MTTASCDWGAQRRGLHVCHFGFITFEQQWLMSCLLARPTGAGILIYITQSSASLQVKVLLGASILLLCLPHKRLEKINDLIKFTVFLHQTLKVHFTKSFCSLWYRVLSYASIKMIFLFEFTPDLAFFSQSCNSLASKWEHKIINSLAFKKISLNTLSLNAQS